MLYRFMKLFCRVQSAVGYSPDSGRSIGLLIILATTVLASSETAFLFFKLRDNCHHFYSTKSREYQHIGERFIHPYQFPVARSSNGNLLLVKERTGDAFALRVYDGKAPVARLNLEFNPFEIGWNPEGTAVAFLCGEGQPGIYAVYVWWPPEANAIRLEAPLTKRATSALRWSPDGRYIAYIADTESQNNELVILKTFNRSFFLEKIISDVDLEAGSAWSPDSRQVAFIRLDNRYSSTRSLNTWDIDRQSLSRLSSEEGGSVRDLSWSPATKLMMAYRTSLDEYYRLAYARSDGKIVICASMNGDVESPVAIDHSGKVGYIVDHDTDQTLVQSKDCETPQPVFYPVSGTIRITNDGFPHSTLSVISGMVSAPPEILDIHLNQHFSAQPDRDPSRLETKAKRIWIAGEAHRVAALMWIPQSVPLSERRAIVTVHGGPHLHETADWDPFRQAFIDAGFIVMAINYGGSSGYGNAYEHAVDVSNQAQDILQALQFLSTIQRIPRDRITLIASSYGTKVALRALSINPKAFHILVFSPFLASRKDIENTPLRDFKGFQLAFHGSKDPFMDPKTAYSSLTKLFSRPFYWRDFSDEGHGLARLSSMQEEFGTIYCISNAPLCKTKP